MITRSLPWNRSFRMGGIQISRDFRVRPDLVTMPLPSFAGKTAVPSAVDLFIDGYQKQSQVMAPGRFVLDNVPVVNGAGQATIVTTDAVGRQISTTIPFYVSSELLRPGLLDFAVEAGFLRQNYGLKSFDYGHPAANATVRYGLHRTVTIEGHGELTNGHQLIGGGLLWSPWTIGTFSLSSSRNTSRFGNGTRWSGGYSFVSRRFSVTFAHEERSQGYRDLASFDLRQITDLKRSDRFIGSLNLGRQGAVGLAYFSGKTLAHQQSRIFSASYSRPVRSGASLFLSADYDLRAHDGTVQLRLLVPIGRSLVTGGASHDRSRGALAQASYDRAIPAEGGLGLNANIASDDNGNTYGQATATWQTPIIELQAGGAVAHGTSSQWASARGSLVAMDGGVFASRQIVDSFAIVSTGVADIPVSHENQIVGNTDKHGRMFIPNVMSYVPSSFALDPLGLAADYDIEHVESVASVRRGAGATIHMPVRYTHGATVILVDAAGAPIPVGSVVHRADRHDEPVGWDGIAYLDDLQDDNEVLVTRSDGVRCRARVTLGSKAPDLARLGPVPCL